MSINFSSAAQGASRRGWLTFFLASLGIGAVHAQEQAVLNYWWVMPEEAPASAPRVIRVLGEKGERYEEVYSFEHLATLRTSPAIVSARLARQEALRREAQALVRQLRAQGKSPVVAYEEAWARVYSRHWLSGGNNEGSSKLEEMLTRLAAEDSDYKLSPEEEQWVLEALLEDYDRLESDEGRELLSRLARRLRSLGYGKLYSPHAVNDQLMQRFADALAQGMVSEAGYRDALFKTYRHRVVRHTLYAWPALWGLGGEAPRYRQAPLKVGTTVGSASGVAAAAPAATLPSVSFSVPGPADAVGLSKREEEKEEEKEEEDEPETTKALTGIAAPAPAPVTSFRSFSLRSDSAPLVLAAADTGIATVDDADYTVGSGMNTSYHVSTTVDGHTLTLGNRHNAAWDGYSESETTSNWRYSVTATVNFEAWGNGTEITGSPAHFALNGRALYLGSGYDGLISVSGTGSTLHAEALTYDSETATKGNNRWNRVTATAYAVFQTPGSGEFRYGTLTGSGELTLSNNAAANHAVIYIFNDADPGGWFAGTVKFGASRGGITELDLGEAGATTAWSSTVFDLTPQGVATAGYGIASQEVPAATILNIRNDVSIAGLAGGGETSTVTNEAPSTDVSHTLTIGDQTGNTYTYDGTFNRPFYTGATTTSSQSAPMNLTKVGSNTQIITRDVLADVPGNASLDGSFNVLTVQAGTLQFNGALETTKAHAYGGLLSVAGNMTVTGSESMGSETVALQVTGGAGVKVGGSTSAYNANVLSGGQFSSSSLAVDHILHVDGTGSAVTIGAAGASGSLSAEHMYVSHSASVQVTGSVSAESGVDIGYVTDGSGTAAKSRLTVSEAFSTPVLRLRNDALLTTGASVTIGSTLAQDGQVHLHGGAEWVMEGTGNTLTGTMYLEDTAGAPVSLTGTGADASGSVVLTLPGVIDFSRSGWDGTQAVMALDGVTLDFSRGVHLTNSGLSVQQNTVLTLASTNGGNAGWYLPTEGSVTVWGNNGSAYHALLGYSDDAEKNIILTIQHEIEMPVVVGNGALVYVEMYSDAASPALPYKAFNTGSYDTGNSAWTGTPVPRNSLLKFANVQIAGGGSLYLGELDNSGGAYDYRAHHQFGGNIEVAGTGTSLHGQIGTWGNWQLSGHLRGAGEITMVGHNAPGDDSGAVVIPEDTDTSRSEAALHGSASVFTFTYVENPGQWFSGKLGLANPQGGIVQLNVGNVNIAGQGDTRWDGVVIDLTRKEYTDHEDATGATGTAGELVLGVVGNATVAGLVGNAGSSVVSDLGKNSMVPNATLTLGDGSTETYTFGGTLGEGRFYTGGQAYTITTTTTLEYENSSGETVTTQSVSTHEHNFYTPREGGLNLVKIGTNTQKFTGSAYLDTVQVQAGTLVFGGAASLGSVEVSDGATLETGALSLGSATLHGGASWYTTASEFDSYHTPLYLVGVYGGEGQANSITLGSNGGSWTPPLYTNLQDAGTWSSGSGAMFALADDTTLNLTKPRVFTNMAGITGGATIALYSNWKGTSSFGDNLVMVEDRSGNFYDADYKLEGDTLYLVLESEPGNFGIIVNDQEEQQYAELNGYIWSGEDNGTVIANNVHYVNMTLGSEWRADGSAANTGWHAQRAVGSSNDDIGVYENGNTVYFLDTNVHGEAEKHRKVIIMGRVAPGEIIVDADANDGYVGTSGQEAQMEYAYALVAGNDTACITDFGDTPTSITKTGEGLLVLNLANTFTGGINVQDGGLYLAAVNSAGTGTLTFNTDGDWSQKVVGQDKTISYTQTRQGTELMVCYAFDTNAVSAFRGSTLGNDIVLSSSDASKSGQFTVSFAYAGYNATGADDHANLPRHWRNLTLSGALVGTGDSRDVLALTGYSSTWHKCDDQSYVTVLTLNEDTAGKEYRYDSAGNVTNRFNGTVVLRNTINTSPLPSNELSGRTAGTVQVVLKGDKLKDAHLNLTRESVVSAFDAGTSYAGDARQTYNNIFVLNGDASVRGLSAAFHGCGWDYAESTSVSSSVSVKKEFEHNMPQNDEVWHVRTLTNGLNTLSIGTYGDKSDTETYVYSGAMGYAQAYVGTSQGHIPWGDGFYEQTNSSWKYGGHSMGLASSLSLVKSSASSQYIHTAWLNDVSVYEGTLGFNNLLLEGNLNMVGGTALQLGVTEQMVAGTEWEEITSSSTSVMQSTYEKVLTSSSVQIKDGKTFTVITQGTTQNNGETVPTTAVVQGNVALGASASLTFRTNNVLPYSLLSKTFDSEGNATGIVLTSANQDKIVPLLDVEGTLTLENQTGISLTGTNFSLDDFSNRKYYLAEANEIRVGTGNETTFVPRTISLGYGYFGTLYTVGNVGSSMGDGDKAIDRDYLVMSITGDPRRTWSGNVTQILTDDGVTPHVWFDTATTPANGEYDYRWKENKAFQEAHVVLFGNLYEPVKWEETASLASADSVNVKVDTLWAGTTVRNRGNGRATAASEYEFRIDGFDLEAVTDAQAAAHNAEYQAVRVDGRVAPFSIILNSEYYECSGENYTVAKLVEDDTNYYFYTTGVYEVDAEGNVTKDTLGRIEDASPGVLESRGFDGNWKTMLHKSGSGTTVMALDNSFSGGSVLQGGRLVMQHKNALGTGGITLMNGAMLQGDFLDENVSGSGSYLGKAMDTTTIANTVTVNVYADPDNPAYNAIVDGRLVNSRNKKLVLSKLVGESDTVLELNGVGMGEGDKFRYGVFKVLDPSAFAGTVTMSGHVWGHAAVDTTVGGKVQLDIMSTTKSADGADWTKAVVDLTVNTGTDRTVLALDATGEASDRDYEYCVLDSITGSINTETGSSSVLNISAHNPITLLLKGLRNGDYDGVLGYGDFQVAVNYGGYAENEQGTTKHHYGAVGHGSLNLIKEGEGSLQKVQRAWLNSLKVEGGTFQVEEALVAHDIDAGRGKRIVVGQADSDSLYALTVGAGGTLAMNTTFAESGVKQDAWAALRGGTTQGDSDTWVAWVLLENGATLSAREDWYTARQVDIATGAAVTINTHNFAIDPYINASNDPFGKYAHSHIIQLLGKVTGLNVTLNVNNRLTNPDAGDAVRTDVASEYMGYVAINDHNDFTGCSRVNVDAMTVLQLLGSNDGTEADVDMTACGRHAAIQVVDGQKQYIDNLVLGANNLDAGDHDPLNRVNNGQLMLGGKEVTTLVPNSTDYRTEPDASGLQVLISARHDDTALHLPGQDAAVSACEVEAEISHIHVDLSGSGVSIGGEDGHVSRAENAHVDLVDASSAHVIHDTEFHHSLLHLQEDCSVNIADAVLVDYQSAVLGTVVNVAAGTVSPQVGPSAATGNNPTSWTKEVTTSSATTIQLTFDDARQALYRVGNADILVLQIEQLQGVDLTGNGLTIQLCEDMFTLGHAAGAEYIALMADGGSGRFLYEQDNTNFANLIDSEFVLQDKGGNVMEGYWVSSITVSNATGAASVSSHMLYFQVPEPATTTLSLLALTALMARRRR